MRARIFHDSETLTLVLPVGSSWIEMKDVEWKFEVKYHITWVMEYFESASGRLIYSVYGTKCRTDITYKDVQ